MRKFTLLLIVLFASCSDKPVHPNLKPNDVFYLDNGEHGKKMNHYKVVSENKGGYFVKDVDKPNTMVYLDFEDFNDAAFLLDTVNHDPLHILSN